MWPMWQLTKVDKKRGGLAEATFFLGSQRLSLIEVQWGVFGASSLGGLC